jgi:arsenate reductase-like glutaredoxin family protein
LQKQGFHLDYRDLVKERLSSAELEKLIGSRDHTEFLNPRNELFRRKKMGEEPPTRREAVRLMAKEPNLIRRPVILCGGRVVLGFDEKGIKSL